MYTKKKHQPAILIYLAIFAPFQSLSYLIFFFIRPFFRMVPIVPRWRIFGLEGPGNVLWLPIKTRSWNNHDLKWNNPYGLVWQYGMRTPLNVVDHHFSCRNWAKLKHPKSYQVDSNWWYPVLYPLASPFLLVIYLLIFQANTSFQFCHSTCNRSVPSTVRAAQLLFGALAQETIPLLRVVLAANDGNLVGLERNSQFVMIIPSALVYKE